MLTRNVHLKNVCLLIYKSGKKCKPKNVNVKKKVITKLFLVTKLINKMESLFRISESNFKDKIRYICFLKVCNFCTTSSSNIFYNVEANRKQHILTALALRGISAVAQKLHLKLQEQLNVSHSMYLLYLRLMAYPIAQYCWNQFSVK